MEFALIKIKISSNNNYTEIGFLTSNFIADTFENLNLDDFFSKSKTSFCIITRYSKQRTFEEINDTFNKLPQHKSDSMSILYDIRPKCGFEKNNSDLILESFLKAFSEKQLKRTNSMFMLLDILCSFGLSKGGQYFYITNKVLSKKREFGDIWFTPSDYKSVLSKCCNDKCKWIVDDFNEIF